MKTFPFVAVMLVVLAAVPRGQSQQIFHGASKANAPAEYIEYPDTRHGPTAEKTYADPSLIDWLLSQHRN